MMILFWKQLNKMDMYQDLLHGDAKIVKKQFKKQLNKMDMY